MFLENMTGKVRELTPNDHTRFQCSLDLEVPLEEVERIGPGTLVAAENIFLKPRDKRYTVLQLIDAFPQPPASKAKAAKSVAYVCTATPLGIELQSKGKKLNEIRADDTWPASDAAIALLDDETCAQVIHQIAPDSKVDTNGSAINIGMYRGNSAVQVGMDPRTLIRGNAAIISSRPRARTTITNNIITSLLEGTEEPIHVVYCDVNNQGTLSLANLITSFDEASILCINDKFVPSSVYHSLKTPQDRGTHKRAVLDYLDMMILPSVLEDRRHDFIYPISGWLRNNVINIYRAHEQTVDEFINDIRIDILEGTDPEVEEYVTEMMDGIATTYQGERFNDKNTKDILEMIDEFSQSSKIHAARRTLYDVRAEVQSAYESFSKDVPSNSRMTHNELVHSLNDESKSTLTVVQGQKPTDILRFVSTLTQTLVEERLKRLKIRTPVLFIFNNADDYIMRGSGPSSRESGAERFNDLIQTLLANGRRHGLGFCLTLEQAGSLERTLARRIQSYFIGPLRFREEPGKAAELINVSDELLSPAITFEDGSFLFASADSPYHRRVPLPVVTKRNTDVLHDFLEGLTEEQERKRQEYQAQEEERAKKEEEDRKRREEERAKKEEEDRKRREEEKRQAEEKAEGEESDKDDEKDSRKDEKKSGRKRRSSRRGRSKKDDTEKESGSRGRDSEPDSSDEKSEPEPPRTLTVESSRQSGYSMEESDVAKEKESDSKGESTKDKDDTKSGDSGDKGRSTTASRRRRGSTRKTGKQEEKQDSKDDDSKKKSTGRRTRRSSRKPKKPDSDS